MPISEINRLLSELSDWYNSYDFNNVSEEEKKQIITSKFVELGIFNIDFGDMDYFNKKLSSKASDMAYNLKKLFVESITVEEKINQLLNNPNIMKFASSIGKLSLHFPNDAMNDLINVCTNQNISSDMGAKTLVLLRDVLKYADKRDNYFNITMLGVSKLLEVVEVKENEAQQADQLIREIRDLSLTKTKDKKDSSLLSFSSMGKLIKNISNDDLKIEFILDLLKTGNLGHEYTMLIETVNSFDKKLELCRKTVDYQQSVDKKYLQNFRLNFVFEKTVEVKTQEDAQYLISKLQEVMADEKLKSYIDSYTIALIFKTIKNDSILISTYNEIIKNPSLSGMVNGRVLKEFIKCFEDDRLKLQIINQTLNNRALSIQDIESLLKDNIISDKLLFLDKSLMEALYKNPEFSLSIA